MRLVPTYDITFEINGRGYQRTCEMGAVPRGGELVAFYPIDMDSPPSEDDIAWGQVVEVHHHTGSAYAGPSTVVIVDLEAEESEWARYGFEVLR